MTTNLRQLGATSIGVSPVAMGCWPIAGMTSLDVNPTDSLKTLRAAVDSGINFFDTAYCYGTDGESEKLIANLVRDDRDSIVLATKCGLHWDVEGTRRFDATPSTLRRECEESLDRLETDHVDLLYLHAPDPNVPIAESAAALKSLLDEGKTRGVGVSNLQLDQIREFHKVCTITAVQLPYNLLQRGIENDIVPWCREQQISIVAYWPLLKGLLAGKLSRDHVFEEGDGRAKYPMFQGEEWEKNQDFIDELASVARDLRISIAQLAVAWAIDQAGITSALCGAKRADQIEETAAAMNVDFDTESAGKIDAALERRGTPFSQWAV